MTRTAQQLKAVFMDQIVNTYGIAAAVSLYNSQIGDARIQRIANRIDAYVAGIDYSLID